MITLCKWQEIQGIKYEDGVPEEGVKIYNIVHEVVNKTIPKKNIWFEMQNACQMQPYK